MGVGKFAVDGGEGKGKIEQAEKELAVIAGQKPRPLQGQEERRELQGPRRPWRRA